MNLVHHHLCEGQTKEGMEKLQNALGAADRHLHPWLKPRVPVKTPALGRPFQRGQKVEPPAWYKSDEANWANIQASGIMSGGFGGQK